MPNSMIFSRFEKKVTAVIILFVCCTFNNIIAQQAFTDSPVENSVLWRISGKELQQPSYLFGTIHAVPADRFFINDSIKKYVNKCAVVVLEANIDVSLKEQLEMAKKMILPGGETIKDHMDTTLYSQLHSYMKDSLKISESKIERYIRLKPVFLSSALLVEVIGKPKAYDVEIQQMAKKKKELVYLETLDEQMSFVDSIPIEQQVPMNEKEYKIDKQYFELLSLYEKQDLNGLDSLFKMDMQFKHMEDQLLIKRNERWLPKLESLMNVKPTFIAVGCGHLFGENGLLTLLKARGYTVAPIYFNNN